MTTFIICPSVAVGQQWMRDNTDKDPDDPQYVFLTNPNQEHYFHGDLKDTDLMWSTAGREHEGYPVNLESRAQESGMTLSVIMNPSKMKKGAKEDEDKPSLRHDIHKPEHKPVMKESVLKEPDHKNRR